MNAPTQNKAKSFLRLPAPRTLSARLLVLTMVFVLIGEVLIYVPSIARFRLSYLQERVVAARIAGLAVEAAPDYMVTEELRTMLLHQAEVSAISLKRPGRRTLIISDDMPPEVDATFDLAEATPLVLIADAFDLLRYGGDRTIRVMGQAPRDTDDTMVDIVVREAPIYDAMLDYSGRILALSIVLALITAGLVFLSLHLLMVRPLRNITDSLIAFRREPEDAGSVIVPGGRRDEIGLAQRELQVMQRRVRAALRQKTRLAALGEGVAKINHDLRNILATAALLTDRLAAAKDPEVQKLSSPLLSAIDRAVDLCTQTLSFAKADEPEIRRRRFRLSPLIDEIASVLPTEGNGAVRWINGLPGDLELNADRDQVFRIIMNLARNAHTAILNSGKSGQVSVSARRENSATLIEITDTGPGLSEEARGHLFEAFAGAGRGGGTGLGLAITHDLMRSHGGAIELASSTAEGTVFLLIFPDV